MLRNIKFKYLRVQNFVVPCMIITTVLFFILSFIFFSPPKHLWQHSFKTNLRSSFNDMTKLSNALKMLLSVDFEVFGTVQGVFFRKYTKDKGQQLGLKGWCMNTSQGTVVGTMQGKEEKIDEMKDWLRHTGSPTSRIEKCVFTNERHISKEEFEDFFIKGW